MKFREVLRFVLGVHDFARTGTLLPTSRWGSLALLRECRRRKAPRRILEVGSGTGAVTSVLVSCLEPGDRLVLCEINPDYVDYLRHRFEVDPDFARVRDQVEIFSGSVLDLPGTGTYDCILSSIPLNTLPPGLVRQILEHYRQLLAPGGTLSYIELIWLRWLRLFFTPGLSGRPWREAHRILEDFIGKYQVYRETVWANLPPGWVRHFRFTPPQTRDVEMLRPIEGRKTLVMGPIRVASDTLKFVVGLGGLAWTLRRAGTLVWSLPLLLTAGIATFLRDPHRKVNPDPDLALSACDGRIMAIERVKDPHLGEEEWLRISAFLSLFDVHINRIPVSGRIVDRFEVDGGAAPAFQKKAENNYACYLVLDTPQGRVVSVQRVGIIARRIVNWMGLGELAAQGERYGLIRMGSRTDVYLPPDVYEPLVHPGQKVVAGITPLARYTGSSAR
ncbi:MAG: methyltransferase domain-containing protein [Burkholderiales bacterium]|jgi:phosphatidylserine decarboxylase|nr:methyltransferase domain-containing protein [Burkholderiales bacterium]